MTAVLYEFKNLDRSKQKNFLFQFVKDRKLTCVYHSHDFYELICFVKGNGVQIINEKEHESGENSIVILRPGDKHKFIGQSYDLKVISLSVRKEEFELFSNVFDPLLLSCINSSSTPIYFNAALPSLFDVFGEHTQNVNELDCKLFLSFILKECIEHVNLSSEYGNLPPAFLSVIKEMKKSENLKEGISAFTRLSNYSQSHLSRLVKMHFNMSLKQYINELRLKNAHSEILLTNRSAEDIAEELGFSSFSHFNKIFKARFSVTPAALRKSRGTWTV